MRGQDPAGCDYWGRMMITRLLVLANVHCFFGRGREAAKH